MFDRMQAEDVIRKVCLRKICISRVNKCFGRILVNCLIFTVIMNMKCKHDQLIHGCN